MGVSICLKEQLFCESLVICEDSKEMLLLRAQSENESCSVLSDSFRPMDSRVHGILQARILKWVAFPFSMDLPNPGIEPRSPTLRVDSLPAEPQGKPKNTGMGGLSLLQQIFPAQEWNLGLRHCRRILY